MCRQLKFYADAVSVNDLVVNHSGSLCVYKESCIEKSRKIWFHTNKVIDFQNSIRLNVFTSWRLLPFQLDQLKFLHIHVDPASDLSSNFEAVNGFKQLVHLEVVFQYYYNRSVTLTLPNLRVFACDFGVDACILKTPKVEVLICGQLLNNKWNEFIKVEQPGTIKRLACDYYESWTDDFLKKLKNLEYLDCNVLKGRLDGWKLSAWKNLKELNIEITSDYCIDHSSHFPDLRRNLANLISQRKALRKKDLKLYLNDVLLLDIDQIPDSLFIERYAQHKRVYRAELLKFINYRLLRCASYPNVTSLDFVQLMDLNVELSADFFDRFPRIEHLHASDRVEPDRFEWFLRHTTALRSLALSGTLLEQRFADNLPNICRQLTKLEIYEYNINNFDFILRFEQLEEINLWKQFDSLDFIERACRQLKNLKSFKFRADEWAQIIRNSPPAQSDYTLQFHSDWHHKSKPTNEWKNLNWTELANLLRSKSR